MTDKQVISIGKRIIILAGTILKAKKGEDEIIFKELKDAKKKLEGSHSKYAETVLKFLEDIMSDILQGRKIEISGIKNDDYIEALFIARSESALYNGLIAVELYQSIISNLRSKKIAPKKLTTDIKKLRKSFDEVFPQISSENIAKYLLIFTLLPLPHPQKGLRCINGLLKKNNILDYSEDIKHMHSQISTLKAEIKKLGIENYNDNSFEYKYLDFNIEQNTISNMRSDASIDMYRSGNPNREYKKLLQRL